MYLLKCAWFIQFTSFFFNLTSKDLIRAEDILLWWNSSMLIGIISFFIGINLCLFIEKALVFPCRRALIQVLLIFSISKDEYYYLWKYVHETVNIFADSMVCKSWKILWRIFFVRTGKMNFDDYCLYFTLSINTCFNFWHFHCHFRINLHKIFVVDKTNSDIRQKLRNYEVYKLLEINCTKNLLW